MEKKKNNVKPTAKKPSKTNAKAKNNQTQTNKKKNYSAVQKDNVNVAEKKPPNPDSMLNQLIPCIFVLLAVVFTVFLAISTNEAAGVVGGFIRMCAYGLFGYGAFLIPVFLCSSALMWKKSVASDSTHALFAFSLSSVILSSALIHAVIVADTALIFNPITLFCGIEGKTTYGGLIGALISNTLMWSIQKVATYILLVFAVFLTVMFSFGLTPKTIILYIRYKHAMSKRKKEQRAELTEQEYARRAEELEGYCKYGGVTGESFETKKSPDKKKGRAKILAEEDMPCGNISEGDDESSSENIKINMFSQKSDSTEDDTETIDPIIDDNSEPLPIEDMDLRQILIPPEQADVLPELTVEDENIGGMVKSRKTPSDDDMPPFDMGENDSPLKANTQQIGGWEEVEAEPEPAPVPVRKIYRFPPLSFLSKAEPVNEAGASEELATNAKKLVDTLMSFKVKTKILSVSRGPTITRYELSPEAGTRVRSISNLVDDISLNLATGGVRIEAPIPGKSAVGIEVPNKIVTTVHLRDLIDSPTFKNAESKINVAIGVDVAGTPVYANLAKMPHLLIAGATGMGKSVCINSIITSILYKATPDEAKLILIDPKKVEFNMYSGLPHLLVPVVSDPQKAAGSLTWAVGEMERRFSMIDEAGARDIGGYNAIARKENRELMPYVVIIIDELADLMMTAPDAVETSICRLAAKARAAGMHLVIGTQRPSVDVITGLIKANIPSRIAFTVASQVDSKTIIDIGGAEKLIGRGDMLYAPVGMMKPLRVQGAFVSTEEVRAVTEYIRNDNGSVEYDADIIYKIEQEAERCTQKVRSGAADFSDSDDMPKENVDSKFAEALELAVNTGKISTSLLQRHLSIGYGRAAKIIDRMQALGYVSPPDGTKPREVLITKQMYMEMIVGDDV